MKKVTSFKGTDRYEQKGFVQLDSSTNFTDQGQNMSQLCTGIQHDLTSCADDNLADGRLFQRTSSLYLLKQDSSKVMFQFFGRSLLFDSSDKTQTQLTLNKWITHWKTSQLNRIQLKMVVFSELSKKNPQFTQLLECTIQDYANTKIHSIKQNHPTSNPSKHPT